MEGKGCLSSIKEQNAPYSTIQLKISPLFTFAVASRGHEDYYFI